MVWPDPPKNAAEREHLRDLIWNHPERWNHIEDPLIRKWYMRRDVALLTKLLPIPTATRKVVHERDGWKCLHCGTTERLSIDHKRPWSKGGDDRVDNYQTLCVPCNNRKGDHA